MEKIENKKDIQGPGILAGAPAGAQGPQDGPPDHGAENKFIISRPDFIAITNDINKRWGTNYSPNYMRNVFNGQFNSKKVKAEINRMLGIPEEAPK